MNLILFKKVIRDEVEYLYDEKGKLMFYRFPSGAIFWYDEENSWGAYHRIRGPAIEWEDGNKEWWYKHKKIWEFQKKSNSCVDIE